jgi:putative ABC transport system permease protein
MLFWQSSTPTGFVFTLGLIMGFVVGVVICYQILSTDVADHLPEYATLKAIGYTDRYLTGVVLREGLLLALLGYLPALGLSWLLYRLLGAWTGLPLVMTAGRAGFVLLLATVMCAFSGFLALRRVRAADPAEVFA